MPRSRIRSLARFGLHTGLAAGLVLGGLLLVDPLAASAAGTTLTVSTTSDIAANAGACGNPAITVPPSPLSLREATCLADNIGSTVTIIVPAGTYNLVNGELVLGTSAGADVTVTGAGAAATIIAAGNASRVFDLDPSIGGGVSTAISGVTISNGSDAALGGGGGGIVAGSGNNTAPDLLSLDSVVLTGNQSGVGAPSLSNDEGGALQFIGGTLHITNSTISNNGSSNSSGSGVYYEATGAAAGEQLTVDNTTFSGNHATADLGGTPNGGALAVASAGSGFSITNSRFVNNTVVASSGTAVGAGLWARSGALTVTGSTFTGNSATGGAGASGGALQLEAATSALHYNRITGNIAAAGSGVTQAAGTVDATENWWGCNAGPGSAGCDTVSGAVTATPRLVLSASAAPSTVTGPNATSTITAALTTDSLGAAVAGSNLGAFSTLPVTFSDPPGSATVGGSAGAKSVAIATGAAGVSFQSGTSSGPEPVNATLDNATATATVTVHLAPSITSPNTAAFTTGTAGSFTVTTTGSPAPAITESGSLPAGLTFTDNGDGTATLAGTATAGGTFPITVTANNGVAPNATQTLTITANHAPVITSAAAATFTTGVAGSFTVTTTAVPVASISQSGALPSGVTFHDNGDGTATLAGTPAAGTGGPYSITLAATNGVAPDAGQAFTLTVNQPPAVTTNPSSQSVNPSSSVTFSAAASGYPSPTVQWQRSTDGGASFVNVPGATSTSYTITAIASDDGYQYRAVFLNVVSSATTTAATLSVVQSPAFTSTDTTTFTVGTAGTFTVTTSGMPNATIGTTGTLPAWLSLTDHGDGTASLTGTPPAGAGGTYSFGLTATNGVNPAASQAFTLDVNESPVITSANHATLTVGTAGSFAVTTTPGFPTATAVTESGALPAGVTFTPNGSGGASIAGTPAAGTGGIYPITITATATGGTTAAATQSFTLTVNAPPAITSANHATFAVGAAGSFTVTTAAGNPAATTLSKTGALPSGVTFTDNGDGTATLAGTPALNSGGSYPFTITAANGIAPNATQTFTLTVNEPPFITSADHDTFLFGAAGSFTVVTAPGVPAATTLSIISGALPAGVSFTDNHDGTATIAGNPSAHGLFTVTIDAGNGVAPDDTQVFTLTVNQPPTITSADHTTFTVGAAGTFTVTTSAGYPSAATVTRTGALPAGVTFTDNGDGTATLAGTPAVGTGGVYPITVTAANGVAPSPQQAFTLTVVEKPRITSGAAAMFHVGALGTYSITTAAGYPAATTLTGTGALPSGITFTDNGNGTATLAGTPAAGTGGQFPLTITATNATGSATQAFTLTVTEGAAITSADHATFTAGTSGTFVVTTNGGFPTPPTLTRTGVLPSGITFVDNGNGSATISGTTTADGTYPLSIVASNGSGSDTTQAFTLTVQAPPSFTSADHATFRLDTAGSFTVTTKPGTPPGTTITLSGALPAGVSFTDLGSGTATIAGTPTAGGTFALTLTAGNGVSPDGTQSFTLTVNESPTITSVDHTAFTAGTSGTFTVTTTPGTPAGVVLTESGPLPSGVGFVDQGDGTAILSGTAAAGTGGTYPLTVTASNGLVPAGTQSFTLTVDELPIITSAAHASFIAGTTASFSVTTKHGFPAGTALSEQGALPSGVSFTDNGDGTATLAGTTPSSVLGSFPLTLTATNGIAGGSSQAFVLDITAATAVDLPLSVPPSGGVLHGVPAHTTVGQVLQVSGAGFAAGAPVTIAVYSTPTRLGTATADSNGAFSTRITVPDLLGRHTFVAAAVGADGRPLFLEARSVISAAPSTAALADTGLQTDPRGTAGYAVLTVLAGFGLVLAARRRRSR